MTIYSHDYLNYCHRESIMCRNMLCSYVTRLALTVPLFIVHSYLAFTHVCCMLLHLNWLFKSAMIILSYLFFYAKYSCSNSGYHAGCQTILVRCQVNIMMQKQSFTLLLDHMMHISHVQGHRCGCGRCDRSAGCEKCRRMIV